MDRRLSAGRRRKDPREEKASEWLAQAHQINSKRKALTKDRDMALNSMRGELDREVAEMEDEAKNMGALRQEEAAALMRQLRSVQENVSSLRVMIESRGTGEAYVEKLRKTMDDVEGDLWVASDSQRETMERLAAEEKLITNELEEMERYFESVMAEGTAGSSAAAGPRPQTAPQHDEDSYRAVPSRLRTAQGTSELPPEVLAVERMLQEEGGTTGGWDERDHERFLRYRTQHRGRPDVYIAKTADDLIDHSPESVEQHERWYVRFQALLQAKRDAIRSWRSNKTHHEPASERGTVPSSSDAKGRARPQTAGNARSPMVDREEQKRRIAEWKAAKEKEQREAEEEEKRKEREAKEREAQKKREESERVKRRVRNYQESKKLEKEAKTYREFVEKEVGKPKISVEQLQRIQERNEMLTMERTAAMKRKERDEMARQQRMEALAEESRAQASEWIGRDPSRLTADTMASGLRKESHARELGAPKQDGYYSIMRPATITHHPMRAPASWRAGL